MNVFILNTGRCGSTTIIEACSHMTNFSAGHESRARMVGEAHFQYPANHVEADNRLSWHLGRLDEAYGDDAFYVHLQRNEAATARSFVNRYKGGIMKAYWEAILSRPEDSDPIPVCRDYVDTVTSNIKLFLKDKSKVMNFSLENAKQDFVELWKRIGAEGDLQGALSEFDVRHNASIARKPPQAQRIVRKVQRICNRLPQFIKEA